ncbi:hypothetical protein IVB33_10035 [Bradyrhizobium sp. 24]|nr:hypothetical protein [Bradyrhizobium sp. 24]
MSVIGGVICGRRPNPGAALPWSRRSAAPRDADVYAAEIWWQAIEFEVAANSDGQVEAANG